MQFLVTSKPKKAFIENGFPGDFEELEREEQAQAQVLYGDGSLREVWAQVTKTRGAVVIFEADCKRSIWTW